MKTETLVGQYEPEDIIADAVTVALWRQIEYPLRRLAGKPIERETLERIIITWTGNKCLYGAVYTLGRIAGHAASAHLFDRYAFVGAFLPGKSQEPRASLEHAYALVHAVDGRWFAVSPANYALVDRPEALHISSGTITDVVSGFRSYPPGCGCSWPSASELEDGIFASPVVIPQIRSNGSAYMGEVTALCVQTLCAQTQYDVRRVQFDFRELFVEPGW